MSEEIFTTVKEIPDEVVAKLHAIVVLGGGVPLSPKEPPIYVIERCKDAAQIFHRHALLDESSHKSDLNIITLSAGTAHLPQLLSLDGLPVWESTASASYLMTELGVPKQYLFAETTSYDTISNAFFTRTNYADMAGWKNLLIITNEFHMERTKKIFDWIFQVPSNGVTEASPFALNYLASKDVGLSKDALSVRKEKELKSSKTVDTYLSKEHTTLNQVWEFLTTHHSFYNASQLVDRANVDPKVIDASTKMLRDSYGGINDNFQRKMRPNCIKDSTSFLQGVFVGLTTVLFLLWRRNRDTKIHTK
jgi:hypothetical protein